MKRIVRDNRYVTEPKKQPHSSGTWNLSKKKKRKKTVVILLYLKSQAEQLQGQLLLQQQWSTTQSKCLLMKKLIVEKIIFQKKTMRFLTLSSPEVQIQEPNFLKFLFVHWEDNATTFCSFIIIQMQKSIYHITKI